LPLFALFAPSFCQYADCRGRKIPLVILAYQRIGEDTQPEISLKTEQFEEHIHELINGGYTVLPMEQMIDHYRAGTPTPAKSVVISFDGPFKSAFDHAFPVLIRHKIPFTVFITPQLMDSERPYSASWDDVRGLARYDFVSFGLHPYEYGRLSGLSKDRIAANLKQSRAAFESQLSERTPVAFAYPFGEFTADYVEAVRSIGFDAAVTASSGVSYGGMDMMRLPRFVMTEGYGEIDRFRMVVNAAPLPTVHWSPENTVIPRLDGILPAHDEGEMSDDIDGDTETLTTLEQSATPITDIDTLSFQVSESIASLDLLRCYVSGQETPKIEHDAQNLVVIHLKQPLGEGRFRVNCTMPGPPSADVLDAPRYRWYGQLYSVQ